MSIWTAFILGLVGSLHCAGMCGPLALALPGASSSGPRFLLGRAAYNLGRIATYCSLGVLFGIFGRALALAGVQRWLSIGLGLVLVFGWFASRSIASGRYITSFVNGLRLKMSPLLRQRSLLALATLGLLNGLLPCGLVYVAGAGAVANGTIPDAVAYMAAFGAGTLPMMLGISLSLKLLPVSWRLNLRHLTTVAILLLGTLLILRGMSLGIPFLSPDLASAGSCCHR